MSVQLIASRMADVTLMKVIRCCDRFYELIGMFLFVDFVLKGLHFNSSFKNFG